MLNRIIQQKRQEVENLHIPEVENRYEHKSLYEALTKPNRELGLIAEIKKASPSKGIIRKEFDPLAIAAVYERTKVDAISVLTDEMFFQGRIEYLMEVKKNVSIPVLRKDFIIDSRQITQSKKIGADAILLIGEILDPIQLKEFYSEAYENGLECLVEVHSRETLEKICKIFTPKILGINNRDLMTFVTSIEHTREIIEYAPKESVIVSESGIHSHNDINKIKEYGASAMLIGEAFMKEDNPGTGIKRLFGEMSYEPTKS